MKLLMPRSLSEADELLARHAGSARIGAGCSYLMLMAKKGIPLPDYVICVQDVEGCDQREEGSIGALVTLAALGEGPLSGPERALTMAAPLIARPNVRNIATLGGNIGVAEGDLAAPLMALDARLHFSDGGSALFADFATTRPVNRIVTHVSHSKRQADGWSGATVKVTRATGVGWSVMTVSSMMRFDSSGEVVASTTAAQSLGVKPETLPGVDAIMVGSRGEPEAVEYASTVGLDAIQPHSDAEASAAYRKRVAPYAVNRALSLAISLGSTGECNRYQWPL